MTIEAVTSRWVTHNPSSPRARFNYAQHYFRDWPVLKTACGRTFRERTLDSPGDTDPRCKYCERIVSGGL